MLEQNNAMEMKKTVENEENLQEYLAIKWQKKVTIEKRQRALSAPIWANATATLAGNQFCIVRSFSQLTNLYHDKEGMMD